MLGTFALTFNSVADAQSDAGSDVIEEVVVSGLRGSLKSAVAVMGFNPRCGSTGAHTDGQDLISRPEVVR